MSKLLVKLYFLFVKIRARLFLFMLRMQDVSVGRGVFIHWGSQIKKGTVIGDHTRINGPILIKGRTGVEIGKYCAIGWGVTIISTNHNLDYANVQYELQEKSGFTSFVDDRGPVVIGDNVWIGDRATILGGVKVGSGAAIGAGSMVTKDVAPFQVVAGVPAKVIRKRFGDDVIAKLLEIKWWDWTAARIKRNQRFFETKLSDISVEELESMIVP